MMLLPLLLINILLASSSIARFEAERNYELANYLFPNQTAKSRFNANARALKEPYTGDVPCVICRSLTYCQALNNLMVQEVYDPDNLNLLGTCYVLEALGQRMNDEVFGQGRSFRDTPECRGTGYKHAFIHLTIL